MPWMQAGVKESFASLPSEGSMAHALLVEKCQGFLEAQKVVLEEESLAEQPDGLADGIHLHPHQLDGLNWLVALHKTNANGILGDDMGLGKTLQSLSMLQYLASSEESAGPFLVVVPLSTAVNWQEEAAKFTPGLTTVLYMGSMAEREAIRSGIVSHILDERYNTPHQRKHNPNLPFHILVTTYDLLMRDASFLAKFHWRYLIVDEAQRLKNASCNLVRCLESFTTDGKLLLTGTPLQNTVAELWSLLHFVMPDVFSDLDLFSSLYSGVHLTAKKASAASEPNGAERLSELHSLLRPFVLRRLKEEVDLQLPSKREVVLYTGLSDMQKKYYKWVIHKNVEAMEKAAKKHGGIVGDTHVSLANGMMHMRKCCLHPYLFDGAEPRFDGQYVLGQHIVDNSSKLVVLDLLLKKLKADGQKVLIFSQMTRMLDILQDYLHLRGFGYQRLDGSMRSEERNLAIKSFQGKKSDDFVFLLSTRAGGVGLNLVAASVVIFYDSDWNPQVDKQAEARVHRIGQEQDVLVIRLVCRSTVEDVIQKRAKQKLKLTQAVIEEGQFGSLATQDLEEEEEVEEDDLLDGDAMKSIIKYGVRDICNGDFQVPPVTEEDIDLILHPNRALSVTQDASNASSEATLSVTGVAGKGKLSRAATTLVALPSDSEDEDDDIYDFSSITPTPSDQLIDGDAALEILAREYEEAGGGGSVLGKRSRKSPKNLTYAEEQERATKKPRLSSERRQELAAIRAEKKAKEKEELWAKNDYKRLVVTSDEQPQLRPGATAEELQFVTGDVSRPQGAGPWVVVLCLDNSGRWSSGGMFSAFDRMSSKVREAYLWAAENKDLVLGDVHLVDTGVSGLYVAIVLAQKYNPRAKAYVAPPVDLDMLAAGLKRVASAADSLSASVHMPRIGAGTKNFNWYATERMARETFCGKGIACTVYYFKRGVTHAASALPPAASRPPQPSRAATGPPSVTLPEDDDILSDSDTEELDAAALGVAVDPAQGSPPQGAPSYPPRVATTAVAPVVTSSVVAGFTIERPLPSPLAGRQLALLAGDRATAAALRRLVVGLGGLATKKITKDTDIVVLPDHVSDAEATRQAGGTVSEVMRVRELLAMGQVLAGR